MGKAQVSLEFSIMIFLSMTLLILLLVVAAFYTMRIAEMRANSELEATIAAVQRELLLAASVEDGYSREFLLPERIDRFTYLVELAPPTITITLSNDLVASRQVPAAAGTIVPGKNLISKNGGIIVVVPS